MKRKEIIILKNFRADLVEQNKRCFKITTRRKRPSKKITKTKRVNKKGYTTKYGKKVGPYNRNMNVYPNPHFAYRIINGKKRLCKIYKKRGNVSVKVVEDKRKVQRIEQSRKVKLRYPYRRTMEKELPDNLAKGVKEIGKDEYEHSIAIDFERDLKQPQRMAVVEGGKAETLKINDFEIYGHSHPDAAYPRPSNADIRNLRYLKPEFIIAGKTGRIQLYNIEDPQQYEKWKQTHDYVPNANAITYDDLYKLSRRKKYKNLPDLYKIYPYNYSETELGREMFFDITGIKIYPYRKGTVIEMQDDPIYEKTMPSVPQHYQRKYHEQRKTA